MGSRKISCQSIRVWIFAVTALLSLVSPTVADICQPEKPSRTLRNSDFEVNYSTNEIGILCKSKDNNNWLNFPREQLNVTKVKCIIFENCSFEPNLSLYNIVRRSLSVGSIDKLEFKQSLDPPSRGNLNGFDLQELRIVESNFVELPADMIYGINLDHLCIERVPLVRIPKGFFSNSSEISVIHILETNFSFIESDVFRPLHKLRDLILYNDSIEAIALDAFSGLTNLRVLDLGLNKLHSLPKDVLKQLVKLETIKLSENEFDELPVDLLQIDKSRLQKFRLSHNRGQLRTLPSRFFLGLSGLNHVELINNGFTSLPADLFHDSINLSSLNVGNNNLTSLPPKIFDNTNLQRLELSRNKLESLPRGIFSHGNLQKLYMNYNRLTKLSSDILAELVKLETLEVSNNQLTYIDSEACKSLKELKNVSLSHNQLTLNDRNLNLSSLFHCKKIDYLNLSHNNISQIFADWLHKGTLKNLNLEYNAIQYVSMEDLQIVCSGGVLNLRNNKITTIDLKGLENTVKSYNKLNNKSRDVTVYLDHNPLHCDCHLLDLFRYFINDNHTFEDSIYSYIHLKSEDLRCQSPEEFANTSITSIGLDRLNCPIKTNLTTDACNHSCICADYPGKNVLAVDCSYRNLTGVPEYVNNPNNRSIQLNISGNKLLETPAMNRSYLLNVSVLDLSSNNISKVSLSVFAKNLQELRLHNNSITRLDTKVIEYLANDSTLRRLTLFQNRWICDCEARNFLVVVQKKQSQTQRIVVNDTCIGTNRPFSSMTVNELCEGAIAIIVVPCLLIAIFGIVLGLLVALYYSYQKEIKVWLYSRQWCLWFVTEDELDKDKTYDAFISFSHKDEEFVDKEIVSRLEDGPSPYKLCLHYRDWLAGEWIPAQIARSVDESRRTIVILSPNFIESIWGRMEFRTAHNQALSEGRARVIVILYGDIGGVEDLDPELKAYLSMNTYVKWGDPWFWDKLRYALPHRYEPSKRKTRNTRLIEHHLAHLPVNNHNDLLGNKSEIIPMPKISTGSYDSAKLLDSAAEDDRIIHSS